MKHAIENIKSLSTQELESLSRDLRECIIQTVSQTGGHLASSLGTVELIVSLHHVFSTPKDKILFDVGHQAYAHKIITGRLEQFSTLRQDHGLSGFPLPEESNHDAFIAGHAGSALSAALGMCVARDRLKENHHVITVVGDASIGCGISFEALNNIVSNTSKMIVILNDNRMAISPNVGALTRYLNKMIINKGFNRLKTAIKKLIAPIDRKNKLRSCITRIEESLKMLLVPTVIFEDLGLRYLGPIDGHNIANLKATLEIAKTFDKPTLIHIITTKGKGYQPAVDAPEHFHGLGQFDPISGILCPTPQPQNNFSKAFGQAMIDLAQKEPRLLVITAAMKSGTGLTSFGNQFPDQLIDVGIAEEHAVIFAAGLAKANMRPIVALYATFLQRALGPLLHDVCLQNLPVIICCDRAGIVDDGPTHHGIHDIGFLTGLPNISILQPKNEVELALMIMAAHAHHGPVVIRYPKGHSNLFNIENTPIVWGRSELIYDGKSLAIFAVGAEVSTALKVKEILQLQYHLDAAIINVRFILPIDNHMIKKFNHLPFFSIEDHVSINGFSAILAQYHAVLHQFGWSNELIPHGTTAKLREKFNMTPEAISRIIAEKMASYTQGRQP